MKKQSKPEQFVRAILRKIRIITYKTIDAFTPYITHRKYLGYDLYYSRGTGLIDRLRFMSPNRIYESDLCRKICDALKEAKKTNPVFVDIGANVGLISLFVLKNAPGVHIYAFEPGSHQRSQLETTVSANKIGDRLNVFPYALSNQSGIGEFHTSIDDKHVGGDGLLDTGRSHGAKKQIVELLTLDEFSARHKLCIDVIKIDIEGAELWALDGAEKTIAANRPVVFFEMSPLNLKAYPYKADDIIDFFLSRKYRITALNGEECTKENFAMLAARDDMFIALP